MTNELKEKCIKWKEINSTVESAIMDVFIDENKYFICCVGIDHTLNECLEISILRDIRISKHANIPKSLPVLNSCKQINKELDDMRKRCISICYGTDLVNISWLNLVSATKKFAKTIYDIILLCIQLPKVPYPCHNNLKKIWNKICLEFNDPIDISKLAKNLSQNQVQSRRIKNAIIKASSESQEIRKDKFTFDLFLNIYETLFLPNILNEIHCTIMSAQLNEYKIDKRIEEKFIYLEKNLETISKYIKDTPSTNGLIRYIISDENRILNQSKYELDQDMNQPLSHYFVNSSHNTYLTGNQIFDKSSVEIYRQVLLSGGRCVEIDIWEKNNDLIVTHGNAICSDVTLRDVLSAIAESAFKINKYPVILSFESHYKKKYLSLLSTIVEQTLGEMVVKSPFKLNPLVPGSHLPSPNMLKEKFLIKMKKNMSNPISCIKKDKPDSSIPSIFSMVNYLQPVPFDSFEKSEIKNLSYKCCSFKESSAIIQIQKNPTDFVNFNKRQMTRIYPSGKRFMSNNYLPQLYWISGCQMVALNFQTLDLGMQLNMGFFEQQNRCGYILKPIEMRSKDKDFDPFLERRLDKVDAVSISIVIKCGQFISDEETHCFVKCQVFGLPIDTYKKKEKIKSITKTGLNPEFPNDLMKFQIMYPKLALFRIKVSTETKKLIGQAFLPVNQVLSGYKLISLKNESAQNLLKPSLLIFIDCRESDICCQDDMECYSEKVIRETRKNLLQALQKNY